MPKKDAARPSAKPMSCDAAQRAAEAGAIPTENFAPSPAEARREDSEARWNAFYKNRWERRRKLLPKLKLKYPDDISSRNELWVLYPAKLLFFMLI